MDKVEHILYQLLMQGLMGADLLQEANTPKRLIRFFVSGQGHLGRWLEESIRRLLLEGYLVEQEDTYQLKGQISSPDVWKQWEEEIIPAARGGELEAQIQLLDIILRKLPDIISGEIDVPELMFPNGSMDLLENIYKNNNTADYFNEMMVDVIEAYINIQQETGTREGIRILEVGAGTGGTSTACFKMLENYKDVVGEYCYTDISQSFLTYAKRVYGKDNKYLSYQIFNAENSPEVQSIDTNAYNIVLATNVLHATKNMRETLCNCKRLLKPNGLILINEMADHSLFTHLTFGLLEGWWRYEDKDIRMEGGPGISADGWKKILEEVGFNSIYFPVEDDIKKGQQIIVAENGAEQAEQFQKGMDRDELLRHCKEYVVKKLACVFMLAPEEIDHQEQFESYGMDSILVTQIANAFRTDLPKVTNTIFFEYQTVNELTMYLLDCWERELIQLIGFEAKQKRINGARISNLPEKKVLVSKEQESVQELPVKNRLDSRDMAVIGVAGRFPEADNIDEFWDNLKNGKNCISEIPPDRWDWRDYPFSRYGGFIKDHDKFDPLFFKINPVEAERMDPQERCLLETAYKCIQDAGYIPGKLAPSKKVGVFTAAMNANYATGAKFYSFANRISYLFDFHGPSIAVDTACSSSLTAIHLAIGSIFSGESECALVGGVNLICDPKHYERLEEVHMLSEGDKCKSFGDAADGFVDSEGVAVVLIKSLDKAIEDKDHIYGIIKGSKINAGGKTHGYTVPNPRAQSQVIREALESININAESVSYIEAHGTGTSLGDPIEIAGLTKAFQVDTHKKQFCYLGSVKSNIGHGESVAGLAGFIKILMQMKYKQIAPSLHAERINSDISFEDTPFILQKTLINWPASDHARVAGLSSFGAGGSNVHLILQEYIQQRQNISRSDEVGQLVIPFSAKSKEQLTILIKNTLSFIRQAEYADDMLDCIAYTLQYGREDMEERIAFTVTSIEELVDKGEQVLKGHANINGVFRGGKSSTKVIAGFLAQEDMECVVGQWFERKEMGKVANAWACGVSINWEKCYDETPGKCRLATYPFLRERYWIADVPSVAYSSSNQDIYPLIHKNISDFTGQKFFTKFNGFELFLKEHAIEGLKILPASAYLEMIKTAVYISLNKTCENNMNSLILRNIFWENIFVVEGEKKLVTQLTVEKEGMITAIVSVQENRQLIDELMKASVCLKQEGFLNKMDIEDILDNCHDCYEIEQEYFYETYRNMGMHYGKHYRGIKKLWVKKDRLIAEINLEGSDSMDTYLIDSVFQSVSGFMFRDGVILPMLPYYIEEFNEFPNVGDAKWIMVDRLNNGRSESFYSHYDIIVIDAEGHICYQIKDFTLKSRNDKEKFIIGSDFEYDSCASPVVMEESWEEVAQKETHILSTSHNKHICFAGFQEIHNNSIQVHKDHTHIYIQPESEAGVYEEYAIQVLHTIKEFIENNRNRKCMFILAINIQVEHIYLVGLSALLRTAELEYPDLSTQVIEIEGCQIKKQILNRIESIRGQRGGHYRFTTENIYRKVFVETKYNDRIESNIENGIFLITGGMGGIGRHFAVEVASFYKHPVIILTGRSKADSRTEIFLSELAAMGSDAQYMQMDVGEYVQVEAVINQIYMQNKKIHGIYHCAGVLHDGFIINKKEEEVRAVCKPKVFGAVNLDRAVAGREVEHFILFSSGASFGSIGQADYAMANGFLNSFAKYREKLVRDGKRNGKTIAICWPLIDTKGMEISEVKKQQLRDQGIIPMPLKTAFSLCCALLSAPGSVFVPLYGDTKMIKKQYLSPILQEKAVFIEEKARVTPDSAAYEQIEEFLFIKVCNILKIDRKKMDVSTNLSEYGVDSIVMMKIISELEKTIGMLPKTLLFDNTNIQQLTEYLMDRKSKEISNLFTPLKTKEMTNQPMRKFSMPLKMSIKNDRQEIAVVGLAGKYPMAENIFEFWDNLCVGRDCISEIPLKRWDNKTIFSEEKGEQGTVYSKWGGFINGVDQFDPLLFHISPREAEMMDPQERLFLQCVYETIEDAGYTKKKLAQSSHLDGNIGVFVGVMYNDYILYGNQETPNGITPPLLCNSASIANRVSYYFDFRGPSVALDTMCSSSISSIHMAVRSIQQGECRAAIAGGVNVSIHPNKYLGLSQGKFLSSSGRCKSFGEGGDGYVPGEGVGAVLLKPLHEALQDGDHIYGIIKSSAINHGGRTNGYTVPSSVAQSAVIEKALKSADIDGSTIGYVEAHGTGTMLGDPIEIEGLKRVYGKTNEFKHKCAIGSVKSNIGHCESAAGIAAVTKVLLQFKYRQLVPSLHSNKVNSNIILEDTPFYLQHDCEPWKAFTDSQKNEIPRRASVSAFGAGGSNAYMILEEFKESASHHSYDGQRIFITLSAPTRMQLDKMMSRFLRFISEGHVTNEQLYDVSFTLLEGRETFANRFAVWISSIEELVDILTNCISREDTWARDIFNEVELLEMGGRSKENKAIHVSIQKWMRGKEYEKITKYYLEGGEVSFEHLYLGIKAKRMSLPTHPFIEKACWIATYRGKRHMSTQQSTVKAEYLSKDWKDNIILNKSNLDKPVIIIYTEGTKAIAEQIGRCSNFDSILVETWSELLVKGSDLTSYSGIIDLTSLELDHDIGLEFIDQLQTIISNGNMPLKIMLVTRGITHGGQEQHSHIMIKSSFFQSLSYEYKRINSKHFDLDIEISDMDAKMIADEVNSNDENTFVRILGGKRQTPYLREAKRKTAKKICFEDQDVVLITGGTRGIGYQTAEHLVSMHGVKRLVLLGKQHIPERKHWPALQEDATPLGDKIKSLIRLEQMGAKLYIGAIKLSNKKAVEELLDDVRIKLGEINVFIHCAGAADMNNLAFTRKTRESIGEILEPKVYALHPLIESLDRTKLKKIILYSSVSSVYPQLAAGQCDYAAANYYLDYFAESHEDLPIVSIQWPNWNQAGMGQVSSRVYEELGLKKITNRTGLAMLDYIIEHVADRTVMPTAYIEEVKLAEASQKKQPEIKNIKGNDFVKIITDILMKNFKLEEHEVNRHVSFQQYGMDSILLAQVLKDLEKELDCVELDPTILIENSSIESLAAYLADNYNTQIPIIEMSNQSQVIENEELKFSKQKDKIAIIGMSCHFPQAENIKDYYQVLVSGKNCITSLPQKRFKSDLCKGKTGGTLQDITLFDYRYFGIPEEMAVQLDPLQRQWLEVCVEAISDAGYDKESLWGKGVGVFTGARSGDFKELLGGADINTIIGTAQNFIAAHLAHLYNFKGPNMVVDTACSSTLTAIHLAVNSLQNGESEIALAGGVDILNESVFHTMEEAKILSPDGMCKPFSEDADGIGLGEGCGVLVLKRLSDAIKDHDKIYSVIDGTAINNDGNTMGTTTPNPEAQASLIESVIKNAQIQPETIGYIETHGTGTLIGDPIELKALTSVLSGYTDKKQYCGVGSVKGNLGHLLSAAGAASVIKVILSIMTGQRFASIHCEKPNKRFRFDKSALYLVKETEDWADLKGVRRAGVGAFGLGGNNGYLLLSNEGIPKNLQISLDEVLIAPLFSRIRIWPAKCEADAATYDEFEDFFQVKKI